jgi:hypothetical protein
VDPKPVPPGWKALASGAALQARTSVLGASTWADADRRRRRYVLLAGVLLATLLIVMLTAAAAGATATDGSITQTGYYHDHDWWDHDHDGFGHGFG